MLSAIGRGVFVLLATIAGLAVVHAVASSRFGALVAEDRRRMLARPRGRHPSVVTEAMLAGLPEPAQRYLRHAGVVGRPPVETVRVRQTCRMHPSPDGALSLPILAEQWYTVDPPGFVWDATVPAGGVPVVRGRDAYVGGHGMMTILLGSLFPLVDASGPEMDQASLTRYLSEMPWFPTAFLADRISWEPIDDATVRVSIADGDRHATGTLVIDPEGRLTEFRSERHAKVGDGYELRPWSAPTLGYGELGGLRLPTRGAAVWTLPDGTRHQYIDVELTAIDFDPPIPI
jgi:hypothetical protein